MQAINIIQLAKHLSKTVNIMRTKTDTMFQPYRNEQFISPSDPIYLNLKQSDISLTYLYITIDKWIHYIQEDTSHITLDTATNFQNDTSSAYENYKMEEPLILALNYLPSYSTIQPDHNIGDLMDTIDSNIIYLEEDLNQVINACFELTT
jgi:hypothetical protein